MDKETKKGLVILLAVVGVIFTLLVLDAWYRYSNKFVYQEHLDDTVITVDDICITLRELSCYVYEVESEIDKQARIYNAEDPLDYWNTYFNSGTEGGYISEMAEDVILGSCVCDLIYEQMAIEQGYELTEEEKKEAEKQAEQLYVRMSETQKQNTGLTLDLICKVKKRKALVLKFAMEYFENVDFTGYSGYREELVSYAGDYYCKEVLPLHQVDYNSEIINEWSIGRITTDYVSKY